MSTQLYSRLFYLACEYRPDLPSSELMRMLGKGWSEVVSAGARHGLSGSTVALPETDMTQLAQLYMTGAESGATGDAQEFRSALASAIYAKICGNESLSVMDQIQLTTSLGKYYEGRTSANTDEVIDWDQQIDMPPFCKSGFWPLDDICGPRGIPQGVITLLARPEQGKTTVCLSLAATWRRQNIGNVVMIQTEMAPSALRMRIDEMTKDDGKIFQSGIDKVYFGRRNADKALDELIKNPDQNRLVIFDSVIGYTGGGDGPDTRTRYAELYDLLMQVKNGCRFVVAAHHVKRGVGDIPDQEAGAGSATIERQSDCLYVLEKDPSPRPDGLLSARFKHLKNRYGGYQRDVRFLMNYIKGLCYKDDIELLSEELS